MVRRTRGGHKRTLQFSGKNKILRANTWSLTMRISSYSHSRCPKKAHKKALPINFVRSKTDRIAVFCIQFRKSLKYFAIIFEHPEIFNCISALKNAISKVDLWDDWKQICNFPNNVLTEPNFATPGLLIPNITFKTTPCGSGGQDGWYLRHHLEFTWNALKINRE